MRYDFGECGLDTASREFTRKGESIHLSPKAFDLLCLLIDQRPRVVSKQELMSALWPDTFVVEANLPVLVAEVREALGERSFATAAIKTHHGIGYSFAADVSESRSGRHAVAAGAQASLKIGKRRIALGPGPNEVGRDAQCDVYINDASVSRNHARIQLQGTVATVIDLDSKNGTRVRGHLITAPTEVRDGDDITFGSVVTQFVSRHGEALSTVTLGDEPR